MDVVIAVQEVNGLQNMTGNRAEPKVTFEVRTLNKCANRLPASFEHDVEGVAVLKGVVDERDIGVSQKSEFGNFRDCALPNLFVCCAWLEDQASSSPAIE